MLTPLPMVYRTPYPWNVDPYALCFDPSTHGIANPLTMVCRPPINYMLTPMNSILTPTHCISNPLPMAYRPPFMVF